MEGIQARKQEFPRPTLELEQVTTPEEFLRAVDFGVLNDILDEISNKSQDERPIRTSGFRIGPSNILFANPESKQNKNLAAHSNVPSGRITLYWGSKELPSNCREVNLLHCLVHEAIHVRGGYYVEDFKEHEDDPEAFKMGFVTRQGFHEKEYQWDIYSEQTSEVGLSLNEAITEQLAQQVLHEYFIRTGDSRYLHDQKILDQIGLGSYLGDRLVLVMLIDELANRFGMASSKIWTAFVQVYMSGNESIHELLASIDVEIQRNPTTKSIISEFLSMGASHHLESMDFRGLLSFAEDTDLALEALRKYFKIAELKEFTDVLGIR